MNLRTYLNGVNFWAEIKSLEQFAFIQNSDQMDMVQVIEYGDRTIFTGFENLIPEVAAGLIVTHFSDKWNTLLNASISKIDITSDKTKTKSTNVTMTGNKTGNEQTNNKVSGYNTTDLIIDTGNDSNSVEDENRDVLTEETETISSFNALFNNLSTIEQSNIITVALRDVAKYLTISIY